MQHALYAPLSRGVSLLIQQLLDLMLPGATPSFCSPRCAVSHPGQGYHAWLRHVSCYGRPLGKGVIQRRARPTGQGRKRRRCGHHARSIRCASSTDALLKIFTQAQGPPFVQFWLTWTDRADPSYLLPPNTGGGTSDWDFEVISACSGLADVIRLQGSPSDSNILPATGDPPPQLQSLESNTSALPACTLDFGTVGPAEHGARRRVTLQQRTDAMTHAVRECLRLQISLSTEEPRPLVCHLVPRTLMVRVVVGAGPIARSAPGTESVRSCTAVSAMAEVEPEFAIVEHVDKSRVDKRARRREQQKVAQQRYRCIVRAATLGRRCPGVDP